MIENQTDAPARAELHLDDSHVTLLRTLSDEVEAARLVLLSTLGGLRTTPDQEVALSRSLAMHEAASRRSDRPGLWKVGDRHAKDMEQLHSAVDPGYVLIRRDDFNSEYEESLSRAHFGGGNPIGAPP